MIDLLEEYEADSEVGQPEEITLALTHVNSFLSPLGYRSCSPSYLFHTCSPSRAVQASRGTQSIKESEQASAMAALIKPYRSYVFARTKYHTLISRPL